MMKIKKKKKAESSTAINIEEASSDKNYTIPLERIELSNLHLQARGLFHVR